MTDIEKDEQLPKGVFRVGNRIYALCSECGALVCLNKPLLGSLHLCVDD